MKQAHRRKTSSPPETNAAKADPRSNAHPLTPFFRPQSIAVFGGTDREGSVGAGLLQNLASFGDRVFVINPRRSSVLGRPAFPDAASLPHKVDLAIVATPAPTVPKIVHECGAAGIPAVLILSAGFREAGAEGRRLEEETLAAARAAGIRIVGPNCLGLMAPHFNLNATFANAMAKPGSVALISQSGALCTAILDWSLRENVGFSGFVSVGAMADVGWGPLIEYFGDDPLTRSIVIYMESVGDAHAFLSAAREVSFHKPIVALKVGRTPEASRAAASHTGALTGTDAVLDAALLRCGVLRVSTIDELFSMAELLGKRRGPQGPRLAIVTNAGGPGALATDALIPAGGSLAPLTPATMDSLNALLPAPWSHGNPIDVLGDSDPDRFCQAVDLAGKDPSVDGLLAILTPQSMTQPLATAQKLIEVTRDWTKPVLASWMGGVSMESSVDTLNQASIPTYADPDTAARAFAWMWRHVDQNRLLYETPTLVSPPGADSASSKAAQWISAARQRGNTLLSEFESKQVLQTYGIPTTPTRLASHPQEAVDHAQTLGYPVAIKLHSYTLTHKSDVGGVRLNVRTSQEVLEAFHQIQQSVLRLQGPDHFQGVTVQPMAPKGYVELLVGSSTDAQFGPVIVFGAGGTLVEVLRDQALGLPPLTATLARRLINQTRIHKALDGFRGHPPVPRDQLESVLVQFSQLILDHPWIQEAEINPLSVSDDGLIALDARIVLHSPETPENRLPRPAIRPYPLQHTRSLCLPDSTRLTLRPIRPEDEPLIVDFHKGLSDRTVYMRYFSPWPLDRRASHEVVSRICYADYDREIAMVAIPEGNSAEPRIIGVGRLIRAFGGADRAEFSLVVQDAWQRRGIGRLILQRLLELAPLEKIQHVTGQILAENQPMIRLAHSLGFQLSPVRHGAEYRADWTASSDT